MTAKPRKIAVLGSTGSIGVNCLDVIGRFPRNFEILGLAAGRNIGLLADQVLRFNPRIVSVMGESEAEKLQSQLNGSWKGKLLCGPEGLAGVATIEEADTVVSAVVGGAGLEPTWAAVRAGKRVALANKETLVMAGELVMQEARTSGAEILPVDSEHSAIFQAMNGHKLHDVGRLILTASGGPFRERTAAELATVTREQALRHPNWDMGAKVTIDSSTLMNKGLEAIEARWLFGLDWDKIAIHIHPQSIVHSLVEFIDGSVLAQLGIPDMRIPIAYALSYPSRLPLQLPALDLPHCAPLTFDEPDFERFPCLALALESGKSGGTGPAVLNAANEVAVQAFLDGLITYMDIHKVVSRVVSSSRAVPVTGIEQVLDADRAARESAAQTVKRLSGGSDSW